MRGDNMDITILGSDVWLDVIKIVLYCIVFYSIKLIITSRADGRRVAILSYILLCIMALLSIGFSGFHRLNIMEIFDIRTVIIMFSIPTVTFAIDVFSSKKHNLRFLIVRSIFEILLVPVWLCICIVIFVLLGMMATN